MMRKLLTGTASLALAACNMTVTPAPTAPQATPAPAPAPAQAAAPVPTAPAAPAGGETQQAAASQSIDATNQNFTIRNTTGQAILRLFVSPVSTNSWQEDVLGRDILANGESALIRFARAETECQWDLKIDLQDGTSVEQRAVNLCQTAEVNVG